MFMNQLQFPPIHNQKHFTLALGTFLGISVVIFDSLWFGWY